MGGTDLVLISNMQGVQETVQFFFNGAIKKSKLTPISILSKFNFLKNIEVDDRTWKLDEGLLDISKISKEADIIKNCINCGNSFKTRFSKIDFCTLKCQNEWDINNASL